MYHFPRRLPHPGFVKSAEQYFQSKQNSVVSAAGSGKYLVISGTLMNICSFILPYYVLHRVSKLSLKLAKIRSKFAYYYVSFSRILAYEQLRDTDIREEYRWKIPRERISI
jgi:hypothetical protein